MANLVLAFGEILAAAILLDAGIKGDTIPNVVNGIATQHPLEGASSSSSSTSTSSSAGSGPGSSGGSVGAGAAAGAAAGSYVNPVPGASTGRIDQGVDYTLSSQGFLAPGRSKILVATSGDPGWGGGGYIAGQLLDGPLAGQIWYAAEGILPAIAPGSVVNAGQLVGEPVHSPYNGILGNIEAGWTNPSNPRQTLAQSLSGYGGDQSSQALTAGYSFSQFVSALGGVAGEFQGAGVSLEHSIEHEFAGAIPAGVPF